MNPLPPRQIASSLLVSLALCALPAAATAQTSGRPAGLQVKAVPKVLMPGESAKIDVSARLPAGAYAFASSRFKVSADSPAWTAVIDGVVRGGDVLGIEAAQAHAPALGVLADPQQPYHAWTGRFQPTSEEPSLISIKASPEDFRYYPTRISTFICPSDAAAGDAWIYVNPVRNGQFAAAPGEGDSVRTVQSGFSVEDNDETLLMGLLLPAVQAKRESTVRTVFDERPTTFTTTSEAVDESLSINFTKISFKYTPYDDQHKVEVEVDNLTEMRMLLHGVDGSVRTVRPSDGVFPVKFERIPDTMTTRMAPQAQPDTSDYDATVIISWNYSASDSRGPMNVVMSDGSVRVCHGVTVLAWARVDGTSLSRNFLKNLKLGEHRYESAGANRMTVSPVGL